MPSNCLSCTHSASFTLASLLSTITPRHKPTLQLLRQQRNMASLLGLSHTPEPKYEVIKKAEGYEIRQYGPQLRATVLDPEQSTGKSFRTLAGYIFGGNTAKDKEGNEKIAMTAPVAMSMRTSEKIQMTAPVATQGHYMSFVMPDKYTSVDQLPIPKDARVTLVEVPATQYAVIRYSGNLRDAWNKQQEEKLRAACARDGVELSENAGDVQVWGYNPPWTLPWFKRNEVAVPLKKSVQASS